MAAAAFAVYLLFGSLACCWRGWLQYRRTGDHGFRGITGPILSIERLGASLLVLGAFAGLLALVTSLGASAPCRLCLPAPVRVGGLALMVLGAALALVAQIDMGASWRVGVDPAEATGLVTAGLFRWVRNPIFAATLAVFLGLLLAVPHVLAGVAFIATIAGIELHVRTVEEPYLIRVHGERYLAYARRVGRFVPRLGRMK